MKNHFNCIYCYTNKVNGKKYVGQTADFLIRHKQHINQAYNENCKAYDYAFHCAIRKYGIENFEIEILKENLPKQEDLNYWECYYIQEFDTLANNNKGYNLASGGSNGNTLAGKTEEELVEIRRKQSEANKGEKNPMYGRTGEKHPMYGRTGEKNPMYGKGCLVSGEKNGMYGKNHSEEARTKMSEAHKEVWKNKSEEEVAEIRKKISEANKGEKHPCATLIDRFTLDGIYIDTGYQFEYVRMGFNSGNISSCCKGKRKSTGGFIFKYHEEVE